MRHREMRYPCDNDVVVALGDEPRRARLVNLSITGAKLEELGRVPRDALVSLSYMNARITARVVWSNDRHTGLRFMRPLSNAELHGLRGVGGRGAGAWGSANPHGFREMA
jgi:hypothetical protein